MLTFDEARTKLLQNVARVGTERLSLALACGRVLAEPLWARTPFPAFDTSAMDGYALCSRDLLGAGPFRLPVAGESRTGRPPPEHRPQSACRIFTGAALPAEADTVIMQEDVTRTDEFIVFAQAPRPWAHVRRAGEDLTPGDLALAAGTRLGAGHLALAASLDCTELCVAANPLVTILCTGDELRSAGDPRTPSTIPDSNGIALATMARAAGAIARIAPFVRDEEAASADAIASALHRSDLLITVGGVSVGDHDLVRPALERAGVLLDFWKVAMKPGKPLAVGRRGTCHVLGLPGNPASAMVTFALFGAPLLRAMQGDTRPLPPPLRARLSQPIRRKGGRLEFVRAALETKEAELWARPLANQASGAVTSMAWSDALIVVPGPTEFLEEGASVELLRLGDV